MLKKILMITAMSMPILGGAQTLRYESLPSQDRRAPTRLEQRRWERQQQRGMYQTRPYYIPRQNQYAPNAGGQEWTLNDMEVRRVLVGIINQFLANRGSGLNVMVRDGVVLLQGQVQSARELDRINRLVNTLENLRIEVQVTTRDGQQTAGPYLSRASLIAQNSETGTNVSDSELKKRIQNALKDGWFGMGGYENVTVEVNNGVVTISGIVENEGAVEGAEQQIMEIEGVRLVKNNLSAKSAEKPYAQKVTDEQIKKSVQNELKNSWWGNYKTVSVQVQDGVVILQGTVESAGDVKDIQERLSGIPGVKSIRSDLTLKKKNGW